MIQIGNRRGHKFDPCGIPNKMYASISVLELKNRHVYAKSFNKQ